MLLKYKAFYYFNTPLQTQDTKVPFSMKIESQKNGTWNISRGNDDACQSLNMILVKAGKDRCSPLATQTRAVRCPQQ